MVSASSDAEKQVAEECKVGSLCNEDGGPLASPLIVLSGTFSPKRTLLRYLAGVDGGSWGPNVRFHTSINSSINPPWCPAKVASRPSIARFAGYLWFLVLRRSDLATFIVLVTS